MLLHLNANRFGQSVERRDLIKGRFIEGAAHQPAFLTITVKVARAKVWQPDQPFVGIVNVDGRRTSSVLGKNVRDGYVVAIFCRLASIFSQNDCLLRRAPYPIEFAV